VATSYLEMLAALQKERPVTQVHSQRSILSTGHENGENAKCISSSPKSRNTKSSPQQTRFSLFGTLASSGFLDHIVLTLKYIASPP